MEFFRPHVLWSEHLRWYQRAALAAWWLGQAVGVSCLAVAAWVLVKASFARSVQPGAALLVLAGVAAVVIGRMLVMLATRRKRRRRLYY